MAAQATWVMLIWLLLFGKDTKADLFTTSLYPGSSGVVSYMPVPTRHTLIFMATITVLFYAGVNLFRRFYLERYDRADDGKLYQVECQPEPSLLNSLFSLSARWGIVRPPMTKITEQHMFAGWAQAFTQCGHYWKKLGDGMVTISYFPECDKYRLMMKTSSEIILVNHELTKNMALFKDEKQGVYVSRWSAVDFASKQPRSETFCMRWNNLGVAESFNMSFYKCTQPACYTDADLFPLTRDKNQIPSFCKQMDFQTQWPATMNQHIQTADPCAPGSMYHPQCPAAPCTRFPGEPLFDIFTGSTHHNHHHHNIPGGSGTISKHGTQPTPDAAQNSKRKGSADGNYQPGPSAAKKQPAQKDNNKMASKPSRMGPQPSRMGPQPSRMGPQPSRMGPQPSRMGPQPSRMGPQPSRMGPQPSRMGPQPSRMGPPKSAMKQTKSVFQ